MDIEEEIDTLKYTSKNQNIFYLKSLADAQNFIF